MPPTAPPAERSYTLTHEQLVDLLTTAATVGFGRYPEAERSGHGTTRGDLTHWVLLHMGDALKRLPERATGPGALRLPSHAASRIRSMIADMDEEDAKSPRSRDSRVYARGYAVIGTYGSLLGLPDPGDPDAVLAAVEAVIDRGLDD